MEMFEKFQTLVDSMKSSMIKQIFTIQILTNAGCDNGNQSHNLQYSEYVLHVNSPFYIDTVDHC